MGKDEMVKQLLKSMYRVIDRISDPVLSAGLRSHGGMLKVSSVRKGKLLLKLSTQLNVPPDSEANDSYSPLIIQGTSLNVLYLLTYLVTVVTRRDYLGSAASCKSLLLPTSMESFQFEARAGDMWDCDCER